MGSTRRESPAEWPPLAGRYFRDFPTESGRADGQTASQGVVLARSAADLGPLARSPHGRPLPARPGPVWRDDFANVLGVWKWDDEEE